MSAAIALGLAYVVVLQMLLAGLVVGLQTAQALAAPGTILCMPSRMDAADGSRQPAPDGAHLPACCVLGCGLSSHGMAPPPAGPVVARDEGATPWSPHAPSSDDTPRAHARTTGNPRAPPASV